MALSNLEIISQFDTASENEKQKIVQDLVKNNNDLSFLISPGNSNDSYNSALIVRSIGFPAIKSLFPEILEWLQDVNWPGAYEIIEAVKKADKEFIIPHIEKTLQQAKAEKDYMWIGGIEVLLIEMNISKNDFSSNEIYEILDLSDLGIFKRIKEQKAFMSCLCR